MESQPLESTPAFRYPLETFAPGVFGEFFLYQIFIEI